MPGMVGLLSLLERGLYGTYQTDVLVYYDAHGEDVLLGLTLVKLSNANLDIGQTIKRTGQRW